nr:MAG TPA_asm: hypothetical protein [Caudoviricetes sp.]
MYWWTVLPPSQSRETGGYAEWRREVQAGEKADPGGFHGGLPDRDADQGHRTALPCARRAAI